MKIEITKKNAETLRTAIWLLIHTCNKNKPDAEKFDFNRQVAKELGVTLSDLMKANDLSIEFREKFKLD